MGGLGLDRVSFAYADERDVLSCVSFQLQAGVSALVGENGAGKTTLLRLLMGELTPTQGHVQRPADVRIGYCGDRLEACTDAVREFLACEDGFAQKLRAQLAVNAPEPARWRTHSPGERRRMQLAATLYARPEVLLLDEPSNHIDADARAALIAGIRQFRGATLLVSHDRALIDELATRTLVLRGGTLRSYEGGYSAARAAIALERTQLQREKEQRTRQARRAERLLDEARRKQSAADQARSTGRAMRDRNDSDARSINRSIVAGWAEARHGRTVAVQRHSAERARDHARELHVDKELGRSLFARYVPCPRRFVGELHVEQLGYGEHVLLRDVHLTLERSARVRLEGPNGAGKTSLLRAFHAVLPDRERVLYVPQELNDVQARLTALRALGRDDKARVLDVMAALGVEPDHVLRTQQPSAGQARKLELAWGLAHGVHALLLDEPTNDLDVPSLERLEAALSQYPGALLVITHDAYFAASVLRERWRIEGQRVR